MVNTQSFAVQAVRIDPDTGDRTDLGSLMVDADGNLAVVSGPPDRKQFLSDFCNDLNKKAHLNVKAPPPAEMDNDDAGRFAKRVPRSDPHFFEALQAYVRYYYGVALEKKA